MEERDSFSSPRTPRTPQLSRMSAGTPFTPFSPMALDITPQMQLWVDDFLDGLGEKGSPAAGLKKLKRELMTAFTELFSLGLTISSRFLAEQSTGIAEDEVDGEVDEADKEKQELSKEQEEEKARVRKEEDVLQLAKAYYNLKEYKRCARVLEKCSSHQASFLRYFSLYLAGM